MSNCPQCNSSEVYSYQEDYKFKYGDERKPLEQVDLTTRLSVYNCNICEFSWTDHEAENAIDTCVKAYLNEKEDSNL